MLPIPAPDPATPTVAAPAPMNLAAESMSRETAEVWMARTGEAETNGDCSEGLAIRALLTGRRYICDRGANCNKTIRKMLARNDQLIRLAQVKW